MPGTAVRLAAEYAPRPREQSGGARRALAHSAQKGCTGPFHAVDGRTATQRRVGELLRRDGSRWDRPLVPYRWRVSKGLVAYLAPEPTRPRVPGFECRLDQCRVARVSA